MLRLVRAVNQPVKSWNLLMRSMTAPFSTQPATLETNNRVVAVEEKEEAVNHIDSHGRVYATGRRKTSSARVWIKPGEVCAKKKLFI
jgi:hypothetical protein